MAVKTLKINFTIPVGTYLKLGHRIMGSGSSFTYVSPSPFFNQTPYTFVGDTANIYEFELSTICDSDCGGTSPAIYISEAGV